MTNFPHIKHTAGAAVASITLVAVAACTEDSTPAKTQQPPQRELTGTPTTLAPITGKDRGESGEATPFPRFVEAVNTGDAAAVEAVFVSSAVFDSVGRIYDGRDEIMSRFLLPEVIELGGNYELLKLQQMTPTRAVAEFNFTTDGGIREHFTYDCQFEDGQFTNCVGRYV